MLWRLVTISGNGARKQPTIPHKLIPRLSFVFGFPLLLFSLSLSIGLGWDGRIQSRAMKSVPFLAEIVRGCCDVASLCDQQRKQALDLQANLATCFRPATFDLKASCNQLSLARSNRQTMNTYD